jgi:hypothetical protein
MKQDWAAANAYQGNIMNIIAQATGNVNIYNFKDYVSYDMTYIDNWL